MERLTGDLEGMARLKELKIGHLDPKKTEEILTACQEVISRSGATDPYTAINHFESILLRKNKNSLQLLQTIPAICKKAPIQGRRGSHQLPFGPLHSVDMLVRP